MKKKRDIFEELMSGIEDMNQQRMGKIVSVRNKPQKLKKTNPSNKIDRSQKVQI